MTAAVNSPNDERLLNAMQRAYLLHRQGRLKEAGQAYARLLETAPQHPDLNNLSGLLCIQTGQPQKAETFLRTALRVDPDNAQSHFNLGIACTKQKKWPDAATAFGDCARLAPENVEAINGLANCHRLMGEMEKALEGFERALKLQPGHPAVLLNLGLLHNQQGNHEAAETCLQMVVDSTPDHPVAWNDLGVARNKLGQTKLALEAFQQATRLKPDFANAWLNRGLLEEQTGQLDASASSYGRAIDADSALVDAHFHLAHLRSHSSTADEIAAMKALYTHREWDTDSASRLAYGLGMALDQAGEHEQAFRYMYEAHRLLGERNHFDMQRHEERVLDNIAICHRENLGRWSAAGNDDKRPVFICGMPRSGTTLVEQILASHSQVHAAGEQVILAKLAGEMAAETGKHFPACLAEVDARKLHDAADAWSGAVLKEAGNALRVTDTTPMNFLYLGLAATLFPHARMVICVRDPLDNCLSIYRQPLTGPHAYAHDLVSLGHFYALHTQLCRHWQDTLSDRLQVVRYEQLVTDPEATVRRLLMNLNLEFEPACLAFHETDRRVSTPSASQVRQHLYQSSVGAWRHYENHLEPLVRALGLDPTNKECNA